MYSYKVLKQKDNKQEDLFHILDNNEQSLRVFLVHPGGLFWKNKDKGTWSIPKGLIEENEDLLLAAKREFKEETGIQIPENTEFTSLNTITMKSGKVIYAWAFNHDLTEHFIFKSNTFELEWPPKSGTFIDVPECDKGEFFDIEIANEKINDAQKEFIVRLKKILEK